MTHGAVVHHRHVHAHVAVRQNRRGIEFRHFGLEGGIGRQRAAGVAAAVDGLGENGVGLLAARLDDHVIGFRHAHADLVHRHRLDVLAIGGHHRHLQPRDAHVEKGHRRRIDETQTDFLAALEQPHPAIGRRDAIHQVGVGVSGDIGNVPVGHAHLVPHAATRPESLPAVLLHLGKRLAQRALAEIVVVREFFQLGIDPRRVFVAPIRQQHDVIAVVLERLGFDRVDDDRAIGAGLLLPTGVAVVPVGAALHDGKLILERLPRLDALEAVADMRHAIHCARQNQAVPVDRGVLGHVVGDIQRYRLALLEAENGRRNAAIDGGRETILAGEIHLCRGVSEIEAGTPQCLRSLLLAHDRAQRGGTHADRA